MSFQQNNFISTLWILQGGIEWQREECFLKVLSRVRSF